MRMLALVCWNDLPPVYQEQEQGLLILLTLLVDHAFHPKMLLVMFNFWASRAMGEARQHEGPC